MSGAQRRQVVRFSVLSDFATRNANARLRCASCSCGFSPAVRVNALRFWLDLVTTVGHGDDRREADDDHRDMHWAGRRVGLEW